MAQIDKRDNQIRGMLAVSSAGAEQTQHSSMFGYRLAQAQRGHLAPTPKHATSSRRSMSSQTFQLTLKDYTNRQATRLTESASSSSLDAQLIKLNQLKLNDELSGSGDGSMLTTQQHQQELDTRVNSSSSGASGQFKGVTQQQQMHQQLQQHTNNFSTQQVPLSTDEPQMNNPQHQPSQYHDQYFYQNPAFYSGSNDPIHQQSLQYPGHFQEQFDLHHSHAYPHHHNQHDHHLNSFYSSAQQIVPDQNDYQDPLISHLDEEVPELSFVDLDEVTRQHKASSSILPESVIRLNDEILSTSSENFYHNQAHDSSTTFNARALDNSGRPLTSSLTETNTTNFDGSLSKSVASSLATSYDFNASSIRNHQHRADQQLTSSFEDVSVASHLSAGHQLTQIGAPPASQTPTKNQDFEEELKVCEWLDCGNTFMDMTEFVRHLEERHVNQDPQEKNRYFCLWHNCKRNKQEFNARYKLLIHMRVHSGEKPYSCKSRNCSKSFSRLENLKIHVRSHTGEKPYRCNYQHCPKSFTNSSDRIKHHKTHEDPKPYNCTHNGCMKRYTDPSSLRKHLRAHKRSHEGGSSSSMDSSMTSGRSYNSAGLQQSGITSLASHSLSYLDSAQEQQQESYFDRHEATYLRADYDPTKEFASVLFDPNSTMCGQDPMHQDDRVETFQKNSSGFRQPQRQFSISEQSTQRLLQQRHQQLSRSWCSGNSSSARTARQNAGQFAHDQQASGQHQQLTSEPHRNSNTTQEWRPTDTAAATTTTTRRQVQFELGPSTETLNTDGGQLSQSTNNNIWRPAYEMTPTSGHEQHQQRQPASNRHDERHQLVISRRLQHEQLMHSMPANFFHSRE